MRAAWHIGRKCTGHLFTIYLPPCRLETIGFGATDSSFCTGLAAVPKSLESSARACFVMESTSSSALYRARCIFRRPCRESQPSRRKWTQVTYKPSLEIVPRLHDSDHSGLESRSDGALHPHKLSMFRVYVVGPHTSEKLTIVQYRITRVPRLDNCS